MSDDMVVVINKKIIQVVVKRGAQGEQGPTGPPGTQTADVQAALDGASNPSAANVFATILDTFSGWQAVDLNIDPGGGGFVAFSKNTHYTLRDNGADANTFILSTGTPTGAEFFTVHVSSEFGTKTVTFSARDDQAGSSSDYTLRANDTVIFKKAAGNNAVIPIAKAERPEINEGLVNVNSPSLANSFATLLDFLTARAYLSKGSREEINVIGVLAPNDTLTTDGTWNSQTATLPTSGTTPLVYPNFNDGFDQFVTSRLTAGATLPAFSDSGDGSAAILAGNLDTDAVNILQVNSIDAAASIDFYKADPLT